MNAIKNTISVLFVCTANICRSPTAQAVFRHKIIKAGLAEFVMIDSAGTHDYKIGSVPDQQAQSIASKRGYDMSDLIARQIVRADLEKFDHILAMDMKNMSALHRLGEPDLWQKPKLLMTYSRLYKAKEVADPYGSDDEHFELALDMIESAVDGLISAIQIECKGSGQR
jgi:protein-tyrosine phosphatase